MKPVLPLGIERVYHYHVRKTAGTSLNSAFWSLAGFDRAGMAQAGRRVDTEDIVFVRNDLAAIRRGDWFFANSHAAAHRLDLPPGTFTVTVLRDPVRRLVSYYQYLRCFDVNGGGDGTTRAERESSRRSFGEFVQNVAPAELQRQLFMFAATFAVDEAIARAAHVDAVLFTEDFPAGIAQLGERLGLSLPVRNERRFPHLAEIHPDELALAAEMVEAETAFVDAMRTGIGPAAADLRSPAMAVDSSKLLQLIELATDAAPHTPAAVEPTPALTTEVPEAGAVPPWRPLTIGLATFDDFDGAYFTLQSIRLHHPEVADRVAFLVVDNNPTGPAAWDLKALEGKIPAMRYLPCDDIRGTAVRDMVFREANSEWVLCLDSHVLLDPGALARLLDYCDEHPDSIDLLQGPIEWDELGGFVTTHLDPVWRGGMYGTWAPATRELTVDAEPFDIPLQGLGLFACRKAAWPGFNPRFSGFGGEEGYIHEKVRRRGGRTLCLPFLRWVHRFQRPSGMTYRNTWEDRIRNYLIGWNELGLDEGAVVAHFTELLGAEITESVSAALEQERHNPLWSVDAIYCINLDDRPDRWAAMQRRFEGLGIAHRVRRWSAVLTPHNHHLGCAQSHRGVVEQARAQHLRTVLVIEDDAQFLEGTLWCLRRSLAELEAREWSICYLGGHAWGRKFPKVPGCAALEIPDGMTCSHALLLHERVYDRILADIPTEPDALAVWQAREHGYDQYLMNAEIDGVYVTAPRLATQASIKCQEDPVYADQFVE